MPSSSYQVVLWKQESFVVLHPLQIEFFRNLLVGLLPIMTVARAEALKVGRYVASPFQCLERNYCCACGCAWTRRSGFKCKVLPAATYTFLSNCVRPGARTSMS